MHGSVPAHRKERPRAGQNRCANARLHFRRAQGNHKLRRHPGALKRGTNPSQIPFHAPSTGNGIHEHNAFVFAKKLRKVGHEFAMLTNTAASVNVQRPA